jgi:hypothetical protein
MTLTNTGKLGLCQILRSKDFVNDSETRTLTKTMKQGLLQRM